MKFKLTIFLAFLAGVAFGQTLPTNYPIIPFSSVTLQNVASNQDAMVLYHWNGSNYTSRRMPLTGLSNLFLFSTNFGQNLTAPVINNALVSSFAPGSQNATIATGLGLMDSNTVLFAALRNHTLLRANGGKPLMGFDLEGWEPGGIPPSVISNFVGLASTNGLVASGYRTFIEDIPTLVGHTNIGGTWYPVLTNWFLSPTEPAGTGMIPVRNFLWQYGMNLGLLWDASKFANSGLGVGTAPYWDTDIPYAETNWGVTTWAIANTDWDQGVSHSQYCNDLLRLLNAIQNAGQNEYLIAANAPFSTNTTGMFTWQGTNTTGEIPLYWSGLWDRVTHIITDPSTYASWEASMLQRILPEMSLISPQTTLNVSWLIPSYTDTPEQVAEEFQMYCLLHSDLIWATVIDNWTPHDYASSWMLCNPYLIAVDQNADRPAPSLATTTNGVMFFVGATSFASPPTSWYVLTWNTNVTKTTITVNLSSLGLATNTLYTVHDLSIGGNDGWVQNTWSISNNLNGLDGTYTNLAPGGGTLYEFEVGQLSDWPAGVDSLTSQQPVAYTNQATHFACWGFNRNVWPGVTMGANNSPSVSTFQGLTVPYIAPPVQQIAGATNSGVTYNIWPATNFSGTLTTPDTYVVAANESIQLMIYTNGVFAQSNGVAGNGSGSSPAFVNFSQPTFGVTNLSLLCTSTNSVFYDIANPLLSVPFATIASGASVAQVPPVVPATILTNYYQDPLDAGLIFNMTLNESPGSTSVGSYTFATNGTTALLGGITNLTGTTHWINGMVGQAVASTNFSNNGGEGSFSNCIEFSVPVNFLTQNFTVDQLFQQSAFTSNNFVLLEIGHPSQNRTMLIYGQQSAYSIVENLNGSAYGAYNNTSAAGDGYWHDLATTYNGSGVDVYLDGSLLTTNSYSGALIQATTPILYIGAMRSGAIGHTRIWNRALNANEVKLLYSQAFPFPTAQATIALPAYGWTNTTGISQVISFQNSLSDSILKDQAGNILTSSLITAGSQTLQTVLGPQWSLSCAGGNLSGTIHPAP